MFSLELESPFGNTEFHTHAHADAFKMQLISHSSIIIFRFWAPAVFLRPFVWLLFRRKKKKRHRGASFQRFCLLPPANFFSPTLRRTLPTFFPSCRKFSQLFFCCFFLLYSPLAGLKATTERTAPLLLLVRGPHGQLATFQI